MGGVLQLSPSASSQHMSKVQHQYRHWHVSMLMWLFTAPLAICADDVKWAVQPTLPYCQAFFIFVAMSSFLDMHSTVDVVHSVLYRACILCCSAGLDSLVWVFAW